MKAVLWDLDGTLVDSEEFHWQSQQLPEHLRQEIMKRLILQKKGRRITIKIQKDSGF